MKTYNHVPMNVLKERAFADFKSRISRMNLTLDENEIEWYGANSGYKFKCICMNGHTVLVNPISIQHGCYPCKQCMDDSLFERFKLALSMHNVVLDESETKWHGGRDKDKYLAHCSRGHICTPCPSHIKRGQGPCIKCSYEIKKDKTLEVFLKCLNEHYAIPAWIEWNGVSIRHRIICKNGHVYYTLPSSVMYNGQGPCGLCANLYWDVFYVVYNRIAKIYKLGITSNNPKQRLNYHKSKGFTDVIILYKNIDAHILENKIRKFLSDTGYYPFIGREYFEDDSLQVIINELETYNLQNYADQNINLKCKGEFVNKIVQYTCPLCGIYPAMVLGGIAFCDNEDCKTISWDMSKSLDELLMDVESVNLSQKENDK